MVRGRQQEVTEEKALWDPLWEYILDDHDSVEESLATPRKSRSRSWSRRQKEKSNESSSIFDIFFENESDYSEETRYDYRDEKNSKTKETARSRRRSQLTEDAGVDNSLWDFFAKEKKTTTNESKQKNVFTTSSRAETRPSIQSEAGSDRATKRVSLFSRFRKNRELGIPRARSADSEKKKVRVTVTQVPQSTLQGSVSKKTQPRKEESMDPFQMILEVAGKLDPFGSDHDSDSDDTATRDDTLDLYDLTVSGAEMDRLVEEVRCGTPKNEVVLNFPPNASDSNIEKTGQSSEADLQTTSGLEENSLAASFYRSTNRGVETASEMDSMLDDSRDDTLQESSNPRFRKFSTGNLDRPQRQEGSSSRSTLDSGNDGERQRLGLRRLACCVVNKSRRSMETEVPAAMSLHAAQSSYSMSNNATDTSNIVNTNIMPADSLSRDPSTQITTPTGPQPYYAYDNTQQHMDVFYTSMGLKPRSSMVVRKLGEPPPLLPSSMRDEVIVQVDASTVSETDCIIRQGFWWGAERPPMANTPGVDIVGKIFQVKTNVGIEYELEPSQPVLSLVKWGGNSRFVAIEPQKLVKIPYGINPTEAACLPETYLTAFQVLHLGQSVKIRYDKSSLRGKSILIVGSMANNMGKAIIELALHGGVANIYATAKQKHWKKLISFGVMPLSPDPNDWITRLEGTIDLVLASNGGLREDITPIHFRALRPKTGRLIMCGRRVVGNDVPVGDSEQTPLTLACAKQKAATRMMNCSYAYDVYDQWERNLELCKRDLEHLLTLLQEGVVKPKILDRIPLDKVMRAHELLESKRLSGYLICEPWMKSKKRALYL